MPAVVAAERRVGDLAHVDVPLRVHPQTVRRREAARAARVVLAPGGRARSRRRRGRSSWPSRSRARAARPVLVCPAPRTSRRRTTMPSLSTNRSPGRVTLVHVLSNLPVGAEDLDAVVLAVTDPDLAVRVRPDRVRQVELAGPVPGSPHDCTSLPSGVKRWIRALPYPSETYRSPFWRDREASRAVERPGTPLDGGQVAGHVRRGSRCLTAGPTCPSVIRILPSRVHLADGVVRVIGKVDDVVHDGDAVRRG